jgi:hypothetical protein
MRSARCGETRQRMTPNGARRALAPACAALVLGCGGGLAQGCGSSAPPGLDTADALVLERGLAAIEASAAAGDRGTALDRLGAMRARIRRLAARGALSAAYARAMLIGVAQARDAAVAELARARDAAGTAPSGESAAPDAPSASTAPSGESVAPDAPPARPRKERKDRHGEHGKGDRGKSESPGGGDHGG